MKVFILFIAFLLPTTSFTFAQAPVYQLSSHILDITAGTAVPGVQINLSKQDAQGQWQMVDSKFTDAQGRIKDFLQKGSNSNEGIYKLSYFTAPYFEKKGQKSFYPFIEVIFEISGEDHYHVPITLSPFGYSTYRGN